MSEDVTRLAELLKPMFERQADCTRRARVVVLKRVGRKTFREIGADLEITAGRAQHLCSTTERKMRWGAGREPKKSRLRSAGLPPAVLEAILGDNDNMILEPA